MNRWAVAFVVACGVALGGYAWLSTAMSDTPAGMRIVVAFCLIGAYLGLVFLGIEMPNPSAGRTGSHRRTTRPDIALPWWLQTVLGVLLAVVVAMLWGARGELLLAATLVGAFFGATAHWWVWFMAGPPWR